MRRLRLAITLVIAAALFMIAPRAFAQGDHGHGGAAADPKHDAKAEGKAEGKAEAKGDEKEDEGHGGDTHAPHHPQKLRIGIEVAALSKLELGPGSFNAEFYVTVDCEREPCKPDLDVTNGRITGKEKLVDEKLHKEMKIKAELTGFVDLSEYPFDKHVLPISIADKADPLEVILEIEPKETKVDEVKLAGWSVDRWAASVDKHEVGPGVNVYELNFGVEVSRPRVAAIFKTFVPAFFMIFVMGFTLLLKPKSAAGRLTAATGALMTIVMFHLSSTSSLPPLGYLTRLDKFMIATYLVYLVNILASVAIVRFDEAKKEKAATLTYLIAGGAVPGVALCAWVVVFMRLV